jgi:hypothetical protein
LFVIFAARWNAIPSRRQHWSMQRQPGWI